jgi:hypothetical protein
MPERWKKALLATTPILMVLLLTLGWKLSQDEPRKPAVRFNSLDKDVAWAEELYRNAKEAERAAEADGPDAAAKLAEAMTSCEDGLAVLDKVRADAGDPEPGREFPFEKDYQDLEMLLVLCRKNPHAPDAIRLKKPR